AQLLLGLPAFRVEVETRRGVGGLKPGLQHRWFGVRKSESVEVAARQGAVACIERLAQTLQQSRLLQRVGEGAGSIKPRNGFQEGRNVSVQVGVVCVRAHGGLLRVRGRGAGANARPAATEGVLETLDFKRIAPGREGVRPGADSR